MSGPRRPFWVRVLLPAFVALLSLNLLGFVVWTLPRGYRQRHAAARAEAARQEAARSRSEVAELRARADRVRSDTADRAAFYSKHVGTDSTEFVEAVEAMARMPGVKPGARAFSLQPVKDVLLLRESVTLPLGGSYRQLVAFLRQVETSPRFITIDGVSMHGEETSGASLQVQLSAYLRAGSGAGEGKRGRGAR